MTRDEIAERIAQVRELLHRRWSRYGGQEQDESELGFAERVAALLSKDGVNVEEIVPLPVAGTELDVSYDGHEYSIRIVCTGPVPASRKAGGT